MKLLVTGGAGFIGSNFILYWLSQYPEDRIVNLDKLTYAGNLENLSQIECLPNYSFVKGDIADKEIVYQVMRGVDTVVHFAAESHVDRSIDDPSIFVKTNVLGTQVLLDAALHFNVRRFHHISTDEVFGALRLNEERKFNENTPYAPRSPYAATKAASDHLVRTYNITYGLPITISNCSNNFGPFQFPEKLIPLAITNALEDKPIPIYGDGLYVRDWLYVLDHCRAVDLIIKKGNIGETYCIGGMNESIANVDVVKKILKILDKPESLIKWVKDRLGHDRRYAIDWKKINKELDWRPLYNFDKWLKKTVLWYKENRRWWIKLKYGRNFGKEILVNC